MGAVHINGKKAAMFQTSYGARKSYIRIDNSSYPSYIPTSENEQYLPIDYNKDWEINIRIKIRQFNSNVVLFGTANSDVYFANPSAEIQSTQKSIWAGFTTNGSTWGISINTTFSENLVLDAWYDISYRYSVEDSKIYCKVIKCSTGEIIGENSKDITSTLYQPNQSTNPFCIGNVARANRFTPLSNISIDFSNSYIINDGVLIWGVN